jgi:hypothetical protein
MRRGGHFNVRRDDARFSEPGCHLSQRCDTRAVDAVVVGYENVHGGGIVTDVFASLKRRLSLRSNPMISFPFERCASH